MNEQMDEDQLASLIDQYNENAINGEDGEISTIREDVLDRYYGELYGNEKDGESEITTREVFETVEWILPMVVDSFEAGRRVVTFNPRGPQDEGQALLETDAVNDIYQKTNRGFVVTYSLIKSCLMNPNSYAKVWYDDAVDVWHDEYTNVNHIQILQMMQQQQDGEEIEVVEHEQNPDGTFNIKVKTTNTRGVYRVDCLPEEEVLIHSAHRELDLDNCLFVNHQRKDVTFTELLDRGYDEAMLEEAWSTQQADKNETRRRSRYSDETTDSDSEALDKSLREYEVDEVHMMVDYDGDGRAERRRVVKIGKFIFENEEEDFQPIVSAASIIMPHRHVGYSIAQSILELQKLQTYFTRQLATNISKVNNPRTLVTKGANAADLRNAKSNYIRVKNIQDVAPEPVQPIISHAIPMMDLVDKLVEKRSGVSQVANAMDPDVLSRSTEGAFLGALERADARIGGIVRILAETVFKDIFMKIHRLVMVHGKVSQMKLGGQWVPVDPSSWRRRDGMTADVGLGLASKRVRIQAAQAIIAQQNTDVGLGMTALISPQNLYNARRSWLEAMGERNPGMYFTDPSTIPPQPQQPPAPDPTMLMIQQQDKAETMKHQREVMKLQQSGQIEQAKQQLDQYLHAAKFQLEQREMQMQAAIKRSEAEHKRELDFLNLRLNEEKVQNDAAANELRAQIERMKQAHQDERDQMNREMEKYKADLASNTQVLIKEMDQASSGNDVDTGAVEQAMNEVGVMMQKLKEETEAPKEIVYEDGRAVGVRNLTTGQVKQIVRDPDTGLPMRLQ